MAKCKHDSFEYNFSAKISASHSYMIPEIKKLTNVTLFGHSPQLISKANFPTGAKYQFFLVLTLPKRKAKGFVKLFTIFTPLIRVISLEGTIIWESSSLLLCRHLHPRITSETTRISLRDFRLNLDQGHVFHGSNSLKWLFLTLSQKRCGGEIFKAWPISHYPRQLHHHP